MKKTSLQCWV